MGSENWAGNYQYEAAELVQAESVSHLQELVANRPLVKTLGTRHSFNGIADTTGTHISLLGMTAMSEPADGRITIQAGVRYGELAAHLESRGFALHNMASLPHISVAGAVATATHGSGRSNGNLSTAVTGLKMVLADGSRVTFSGDELAGSVVHLGALGVMYELELRVEPTYQVSQVVYRDIPLSKILGGLDAVSRCGYSVSLFTSWQSQAVDQVWVKLRGGSPPNDLFDQEFSPVKLHPISTMPALFCTEQCNIPGPWFDRLPHFRLEFTPSSGEELQSEFFVPFAQATAAISAVSELGAVVSPVLQISEIRFIAADDLWMSPCYRQECIGLHFTWIKDWAAVEPVLSQVEKALAPFGARAHWGKLTSRDWRHDLGLYPKFGEFKALREKLDPSHKFRNKQLDFLVAI